MPRWFSLYLFCFVLEFVNFTFTIFGGIILLNIFLSYSLLTGFQFWYCFTKPGHQGSGSLFFQPFLSSLNWTVSVDLSKFVEFVFCYFQYPVSQSSEIFKIFQIFNFSILKFSFLFYSFYFSTDIFYLFIKSSPPHTPLSLVSIAALKALVISHHIWVRLGSAPLISFSLECRSHFPVLCV